MTTLILQTVGATVGGMIGGPAGAAIGASLGSAIGQRIDHDQFFGSSGSRVSEGPRLSEMQGIASTEGAPIPRLYGRARLGGTMIWATRFEETVVDHETGQGKGGGSSGVTTRTYSYRANFAIGLCEGPIGFVRRIWANGTEIDQTLYTIRVHAGHETQDADPLIIAKEGIDNAPAYRGLAYIVFESFPLELFGNHIPQFSFEVIRPIGGYRTVLKAVNLIPGAGEFAYDPSLVTATEQSGSTFHLNRHDLTEETDFSAAIDRLSALCPELSTVQLVITWFGDDLRADHCTIAPRVDSQSKATVETEWIVSGLTRRDARLVSMIDGRPAYGGTPSDSSVIRAIRALKERGYRVTIYPFVMMDIPDGSRLVDPHNPSSTQPPYPWRGRITCCPAPGLQGSPAGTARVSGDVMTFFGTARVGDFRPQANTVAYSGAPEWSWRRMILHYAALAKSAGGVDGFLIGSELRDLTIIEDAPGEFPAVRALVALARDVKTILGASTAVSYAADWTEYGGRIVSSGALRFPLDQLWADTSIDGIGIDAYFPLTDWRDGDDGGDRSLTASLYARDFLQSRLSAGEAFDWYYANENDRMQANRLPISDGRAQKPWVFRSKDLLSWWSNPHYERVDGQERTRPTAWIPKSKSIWFTEFGCPAIDRGSNAPNIFPDSKSIENSRPPFSRGGRDDLIQTRVIEAYLSQVDPAHPDFSNSTNPVSPLTGKRMIDPGHCALWAYDARPFPAFPGLSRIWSDAQNYFTGHWINGRLEACALDHLLRAILKDFDIDDVDIGIDGFLDGYVITSPTSARAALEPLSLLFGFDCQSSDRLKFVMSDPRYATSLALDDLVAGKDKTLVSVTRLQTSELPSEMRLAFCDSEYDYRSAIVASRRLSVATKREMTSAPAIVTTRDEAQKLVDRLLVQAWARREHASFSMRPARLQLESGDFIRLESFGHQGVWRIERIIDRGLYREVESRSAGMIAIDPGARLSPLPTRAAPQLAGRPSYVIVDLPIVTDDREILQVVGAMADPWPGSLSVWRSVDGTHWSFFGTITRQAMIGETISALASGPVGQWDRTNSLTIRFLSGRLLSQDEFSACAGEQALVVQADNGAWEVINFTHAELVAPLTWRISNLLRGLGGSEPIASLTHSAGARVVKLDGSLLPIASGLDDLSKSFHWRLSPQGRDYMYPTAVAFDSTSRPDALTPLSPVHARVTRTVAGILIRFIRRGRIHADSWASPDIPLDQSRELYEIDIFKSGSVIRTLSTSVTEALYPIASEIADFGETQSRLTMKIYQIGDGVGRGIPAVINGIRL